MHTGRVIIINIAAIGLLVTACGDDTQALSKPEFVEQANAFCQASNDEVEPIFDAVFAELDGIDVDDPANEALLWERWDGAVDRAMPIFDRQLDDIRALEPPADDKELIETLLADQRAALDEFAGLVDDAAAGDASAIAILDSDEDAFTDINRRAREYGLTVCGEGD